MHDDRLGSHGPVPAEDFQALIVLFRDAAHGHVDASLVGKDLQRSPVYEYLQFNTPVDRFQRGGLAQAGQLVFPGVVEDLPAVDPQAE